MRLEEPPDALGGVNRPAVRLRPLAVDEVRGAPRVVLAVSVGRRAAAAVGPCPPGARGGDEPGAPRELPPARPPAQPARAAAKAMEGEHDRHRPARSGRVEQIAALLASRGDVPADAAPRPESPPAAARTGLWTDLLRHRQRR